MRSDTDRGNDRSANRGGLAGARHLDREAGHVGLDLVPAIVPSRSAAGPHRGYVDAGRQHRRRHVPDRQRRGLEHGSDEMGPRMTQRESREDPTGRGIPER